MTPLPLAQAQKVLRQELTQWLASAKPLRRTEAVRYISISIPIIPIDPMHWCESQPHSVQTAWSNRAQNWQMAGVGTADLQQASSSQSFQTLLRHLQFRLMEAPEFIRYYGGIRFLENGTQHPEWTTFGKARFILPRIELRRQNDRAQLLCHLLQTPDTQPHTEYQQALETVEQLTWEFPDEALSKTMTLPRATETSYTPDLPHWHSHIETALQAFREGSLEKVVLARRTQVRLTQTISPLALLRRLRTLNPMTFQFCFQTQTGTAFLGASPERLFSRQGTQLCSEAIAGTRRRGKTPHEDDRLAQQLRRSDKDVHEHLLVLDKLRTQFAQLCEQVRVKDTLAILRLSHVQHLQSQIQGELRDPNDLHTLETLHPTPAVGGHPTRPALHLLNSLEGFDRGWYAAPVGWLSSKSSEFAVAIRSGLLEQESLSLYSGAGIVPGSNPQEEWDEINRKIDPFVELLGGGIT